MEMIRNNRIAASGWLVFAYHYLIGFEIEMLLSFSFS
jgi:hypothetical protein